MVSKYYDAQADTQAGDERARATSPMPYMVAIAIGGIIWLASGLFLPQEMRLSRVSLGIFSKVDIIGWMALAAGLATIMLNSQGFGKIRGAIQIVVGLALLIYSYVGALHIAAHQGPDTLAKYVVAEIGCFPKGFEAIAVERGFTLPAEEKICGYKAPGN